MDDIQFRSAAHEVIDYILQYQRTVRDRPVLSSVEPGYLRRLVPSEAPPTPDRWTDVLADMERVIQPGMTHWHSPHFHAFCPLANSPPALLAEMLAHGLSCVGLSWEAAPACLELEVVVLDWLVRLLGLPKHFLSQSGAGGGVITGSATEGVLLTITAARERALKDLRRDQPDLDEATARGRLVAFASAQANPAVFKAAASVAVRIRVLPTGDECRLRGDTLQAAVEEELAAGNVPIYILATLGTTGTCAFDPLDELGAVCRQHELWLHVDAAYAGAAFVCPEFRHLLSGVEEVTSFSFNAHKWMLVNFECAVLWVRDSGTFTSAHEIDAPILHTAETTLPNFRNWSLALGRRFRALKLWFVLRLYGVSGLQEYIRGHVQLAGQFEELVRRDERFEVVAPASMGVVCFRVRRGGDSATEELLRRVNDAKKVFIAKTTLANGALAARFVVVSRVTTAEDVVTSWEEIRRHVQPSQEWSEAAVEGEEAVTQEDSIVTKEEDSAQEQSHMTENVGAHPAVHEKELDGSASDTGRSATCGGVS
ncbi:3,4-dihydroxyphenylacetaldehyde synthase 2-like [Amphibalanus amphitrite]|uniref:3,4-dihydroxyphenylacetaldehyde synthase 2-like n=1 Tax=Amphibalanus amphitrite TaxID=1232801 RepID=UPI001C90CEAF|nr:3,4-dihydroxyphenylacetaldehyde synthase 2-like [Amphibalanus amphitrite]